MERLWLGLVHPEGWRGGCVDRLSVSCLRCSGEGREYSVTTAD